MWRAGCLARGGKEIDDLTAIAKRKGAKGLAQFTLAGETIESQVAKFLSPEELAGIRRVTGAKARHSSRRTVESYSRPLGSEI